MDQERPVSIAIGMKLHDQEAWDLAQFVKRINWDHIRGCAVNDDEAYRMRDVIAKLRVALADAGYAPR